MTNTEYYRSVPAESPLILANAAGIAVGQIAEHGGLSLTIPTGDLSIRERARPFADYHGLPSNSAHDLHDALSQDASSSADFTERAAMGPP